MEKNLNNFLRKLQHPSKECKVEKRSCEKEGCYSGKQDKLQASNQVVRGLKTISYIGRVHTTLYLSSRYINSELYKFYTQIP